MDDDTSLAGLIDAEPDVESEEDEDLEDGEGSDGAEPIAEEKSRFGYDAEPSIGKYLQEIRKYPLLGAREEAVGKEIENGQAKIKSVIAGMSYYAALKGTPEVIKLQQMAEEERENPDDPCEEVKDVAFVICLDSLQEAMMLLARNAKNLADDVNGNGSRTKLLASDTALRMRIVEKFHEPIKDLEKKWQVIMDQDARISSAKNELVEGNLRMVVFYAKRYVNRGLGLGDLIEEGNLGLMRAADKFIPSKGFKFSTYVSWWIKQAVERGLTNQSRTIRIPVHQCEMLGALYRTEKRLRKASNLDPTPKMIAEDMGIDIRKVERLIAMREIPLSLSHPIGDDQNDTLADMIPDDHNPRPDHLAEQIDMHEFVYAVLRKMPENERFIIINRFGLDGKDEMSLDQVGKHLGVTRERVRQIETRALGTLRRVFINHGLTLKEK